MPNNSEETKKIMQSIQKTLKDLLKKPVSSILNAEEMRQIKECNSYISDYVERNSDDVKLISHKSIDPEELENLSRDLTESFDSKEKQPDKLKQLLQNLINKLKDLFSKDIDARIERNQQRLDTLRQSDDNPFNRAEIARLEEKIKDLQNKSKNYSFYVDFEGDDQDKETGLKRSNAFRENRQGSSEKANVNAGEIRDQILQNSKKGTESIIAIWKYWQANPR